jgi:hypothetical protein
MALASMLNKFQCGILHFCDGIWVNNPKNTLSKRIIGSIAMARATTTAVSDNDGDNDNDGNGVNGGGRGGGG